jgi:phage terminase large subunit-like protein
VRGRWESPDGRYYFDVAAADKFCDFFPTFLRHHKGEFGGTPFELLPYQAKTVIRPLFGWKHASDGLRRFRKVFLAIPKGNGKSPLGSGLGLALLLCDQEQGAEIYAVAADREQAKIVFNTSKIMVEESADLDGDGRPDLLAECDLYARSMVVPLTHSTYQVRSADVASAHGPNVHGLIFDEFHAQPNRELYEALHRGTVKRRQPVTLMMTTAGDDDETIAAEEWEYARRIQRDPAADETYLPVLFESSTDDDWMAPDTWKRVNPGYGVTVKAEALAVESRAAQLEPRKRNDFLRYHLNRWVSQATAWIPIEWWDACELALPGDEVLQGLTCAGGLDLAQKTDLAAFVALFREPIAEDVPAPEIEIVATEPLEGGRPDQLVTVKRKASLNYRLYLVPFFWLPEDTLRQRAKEDRVQYDVWRDLGLLRATEGTLIDYDVILRDITEEIGPRFNLQRGQVGYDPAFASDIAPKIAQAGYQTVEILQGYKYLSEPAQLFEGLLKAGRVHHDGHKLMRWNVENVSIKQDDSGRIRPVKPKRAIKRIDGVVATLIALNRLMAEPEMTDEAPIQWL